MATRERVKLDMVLPAARANYAYVFKPRASDEPGKEGSYSITLAIPKDDDKSPEEDINSLILEAARSKWGDEASRWLERGKIASPLHDGDDNDDETMHGHWLITARRKESFGPPGVVDARVMPIVNQTDFYSGCICYASVSFFPYENKGKKGVGCGLNNLQKIKDGERIGGKTDPKQDFKPLSAVNGKKTAPTKKARPAHDEDDDDIPF
jgi:Protein of unknown function (DUF2815)